MASTITKVFEKLQSFSSRHGLSSASLGTGWPWARSGFRPTGSASEAPQDSRQPAPLAPAAGGFPPGTEAFTINFARPHPLKAYAQRILPIVTRAYLAANVAVCLALVASACYLWIQRSGPSTMASPAAAIDEIAVLQQHAKQNLAELNANIAVQQQQFPAAGKLAALANTLPPRTWITAIEGKREGRAITIQALYLIDPEKPYELPAKGWIDALKADPVFGRQLKQLSLLQSSRENRGNAELFSFDLAAEWSR